MNRNQMDRPMLLTINRNYYWLSARLWKTQLLKTGLDCPVSLYNQLAIFGDADHYVKELYK